MFTLGGGWQYSPRLEQPPRLFDAMGQPVAVECVSSASLQLVHGVGEEASGYVCMYVRNDGQKHVLCPVLQPLFQMCEVRGAIIG